MDEIYLEVCFSRILISTTYIWNYYTFIKLLSGSFFLLFMV